MEARGGSKARVRPSRPWLRQTRCPWWSCARAGSGATWSRGGWARDGASSCSNRRCVGPIAGPR
eukprot:4078597-Alexandrium_andersonii.AAC.1